MTLRNELLQELEEARQDLLSAMEVLSDAEIGRPLSGGDWSAKDVLAHLASWDELRAFEIARVARGDTPLYADMQEQNFAVWNQTLMSARRALSVDQVRRELDYARKQVLAAVAAVPDERLPDVANGRVRIRRAAAHDREHAEQIRAWRKSQGL